MTSINPNLRINIPTAASNEPLLQAMPTVTTPTQSSVDVMAEKPALQKQGLIGCIGVSTKDSSHHPDNAGQISEELAGALRGIDWGAAVEATAQEVSVTPEKLETKIIDITQPTARQWNTSNIGAFIQAVLRESYMLQSEQLLDFANKVKHCNLQKKGLREHLAKLRDIKTTIGPVTEEQAAHTTLSGTNKETSVTGPTQTTSKSLPELDQVDQIAISATIRNIQSHKSSSSETTLEERLINTPGYRREMLEAIPHMSTQELWHLVHALGGSDFKVADEIDTIWQDIVDAMRPEQLVEMSSTQASAQTLEACNGTHKIQSNSNINKLSQPKVTPRNLLNDCCELSRVAASRYQTIRDYTGAELEAYGIAASVGGPESLLIALEEVEMHKSNQVADESLASSLLEQSAVAVNGYIEAVTVTDLGPDLVATGKTVNTVAELDDEIEKLEDLLNSVGEDAQMANLDLQNALQKQQQLLQMMSNMSKTMHETAMSIIRKIGS